YADAPAVQGETGANPQASGTGLHGYLWPSSLSGRILPYRRRTRIRTRCPIGGSVAYQVHLLDLGEDFVKPSRRVGKLRRNQGIVGICLNVRVSRARITARR